MEPRLLVMGNGADARVLATNPIVANRIVADQIPVVAHLDREEAVPGDVADPPKDAAVLRAPHVRR